MLCSGSDHTDCFAGLNKVFNLVLIFHFRFKEQRTEITEDQRPADSCGTGSKPAQEEAEGAFFVNGSPYTAKQCISEAEKRNRGAGAGPVDKGLIEPQKSKNSSGTDKEHHNAPGHELRMIHEDLNQRTD